MENTICSYCNKDDLCEVVYLYKKNQVSIKNYGEILELRENKVNACKECVSKVRHLTEIQFCDLFGIEPVSVAGKIIKRQFKLGGCCGL